jgi:RHS repeat-associated protein
VVFCLCVGKALGCCFGSCACKCGSGHVPVCVGAKGMTRKPAEGLACDGCAWVNPCSARCIFVNKNASGLASFFFFNGRSIENKNIPCGMGCFKLEAYRNREEHSFEGVWKKSDQEKEVANYYPFGLVSQSSQRESSLPNDYKYNGKEEQTELGLGWLDYGMRMYQPELGRFFAQDRFAEKYYDHSPYSYGLNNPALYVDINGDSVWTTHQSTVDKQGNTNITHTVHIQGKVLKQSNGNTKASDVASGLNARLGAQSNTTTRKNQDGTTTTETTNMSANFTEAKSMGDVSQSDHLVVIVDGVQGQASSNLGGGDAVGLGEFGGQIAYIEGGAGAVETAFHEVGHNLGLPHPDRNASSDPMSYAGRGANFSPAQMNVIYENSLRGIPNRGSNYGAMGDHFPKVLQGTFYGTTSNERPFSSAPPQRSHIPLPLINPNK